jgi:hypothetical protein
LSRFRCLIDPERPSQRSGDLGDGSAHDARIFPGTQSGVSGVRLEPLILAIHVACAASVGASILGAAVATMGGQHRSAEHVDAPVRVDR